MERSNEQLTETDWECLVVHRLLEALGASIPPIRNPATGVVVSSCHCACVSGTEHRNLNAKKPRTILLWLTFNTDPGGLRPEHGDLPSGFDAWPSYRRAPARKHAPSFFWPMVAKGNRTPCRAMVQAT